MRRPAACAAVALLSLATATVALADSATQPAGVPAAIPDLTHWLGNDGKPDAGTWGHAAHFTLDNEWKPGHNLPAPVATDVFVGYTKTALWVHYVASDPNPDDIRGTYRRRDSFSPLVDDYVAMDFIPSGAPQWGYQFVCTAGGTEGDVLRRQVNQGSTFDAIWYCNAKLTSTGYTVTMQIPFRSLDFPQSSKPQTWRLFLYRSWPRQVRYWMTQVKLDYNDNCKRLCQSEVVRTETPIDTHGSHFQLIPAVTLARTDSRSSPDSGLKAGNPGVSGGLDARWAIRSDLVWSATLKPDFSQVAPDVLQATVNQRFALYYPENRPFFNRGTWVFNTPGFNFGLSGPQQTPFQSGSNDSFVDTRQIASPQWASKIIGQIGKHTLGALVANDSITNILMPGEQASNLKSFDFATHDALLRYRYDLTGRSAIGALATVRRGGGYDNNLVAVGGNWQIDASDTLTVQTAHSKTTYPTEVATAFGIASGTVTGNGVIASLQRTRKNYNASLSAGYMAPGFRADLGYQPQVGFSEVHPEFEYDWYSSSAWWQKSGVGGGYEWVQAADGGHTLDRKAQAYAFVQTLGQTQAGIFVRHDDQFFAGRIFALDQQELELQTQPTSWLWLQLDATTGDGVDYVGARKGDLLSIAPSITLTPGRHLKLAFVGNFERLDVSGGRLYTTDLYDLRLAWYFNSRMFARAIAQEQDVHRNTALYPVATESRKRTLATQLLFGYELNPWTSLFAGFTNNYLGTGDVAMLQQGRTYFLKLSYALQR